MISGIRLRQAALRILCALLLLFAGLAHRPVTVQAAPAQLAFELPDGTTPDLCVGTFGTQKGQKTDYGCDACRLTGSTMLPAPPVIAHAAPVFVASALLPASQTSSHTFLHRSSAPPRAPPLAFV